MLRIVMDGAGDMPEGWAEAYDIHVIPINIQFKDQSFLQGVDLSNEQFYDVVQANGMIPKTSQPTPYQFIEFYKRIAQVGDTILSLHVTSKLSGTFESAKIAAKELQDRFTIIPFDTGAGSAAMGYMVREARILERTGASLQVILDRMRFISRNVSIILTLNTLDYARMSGRVKALQATIASMLNVKPIVVLRDGMLNVSEKVRTRQKSLERVIARIKERFDDLPINVAVVQARDEQAGASLIDQVKKCLNCRELILTELSIGVAANLGPGTVGIVAYPVEEGH